MNDARVMDTIWGNGWDEYRDLETAMEYVLDGRL